MSNENKRMVCVVYDCMHVRKPLQNVLNTYFSYGHCANVIPNPLHT